MIDAHCHIDAYADPYQTALVVDRARVLTIAVTNLPTDFARAYPHVRPLRYIRLALGLHPLLAAAHVGERDAFRTYLGRTSYVGEVGLDFSSEGQATRVEQIESFRFVLQLLRAHPKFVSVHSRQAESAVLDLVEQIPVGPVVFHWFGGSLLQLERLLSLGHYCSINPAMLRSTRGRAIVERLPRDRVLTETDGPFVQVRDARRHRWMSVRWTVPGAALGRVAIGGPPASAVQSPRGDPVGARRLVGGGNADHPYA